MKDSYSFDRDAEAMDECYRRHAEAYARMCDRCGLEWYRVEADVGVMGGLGSDEYMAPCAAGENDVVLAPGYAANLEVRAGPAGHAVLAAGAPEEVPTPGSEHDRGRGRGGWSAAGRVLKAYPVVLDEDEMRLVMVRGDHSVNEIKLRRARSQFRAARGGDRARPGLRASSVQSAPMRILLDQAVAIDSGGVTWPAPTGPISTCAASRPAVISRLSGRRPRGRGRRHLGGAEVRIVPAIEVGNIFKLGTRYTEPLGATYLDDTGRSQLVWMGCYGFGPARAAAAAVEQYADEHGISWPRAVAPFDIELVVLGKPGSEERSSGAALRGTACDRHADPLRRAGRRPG